MLLFFYHLVKEYNIETETAIGARLDQSDCRYFVY